MSESGMPFAVHWDDIGIPSEAREAWAMACGIHVQVNAAELWERPDWDWRAILADRYDALYTIFNYGVDSPIEARMAGWLVWLNGDFFGLPQACHEPWFDPSYQFDKDEFAFTVQPQVDVGNYRVDFMILIRGNANLTRIAVECDGHDFHEKTKEQAARDKKRDRDLLLAGVKVLRFTGSEIYRDAIGCFTQIQQAVCQAVSEAIDYRRG